MYRISHTPGILMTVMGLALIPFTGEGTNASPNGPQVRLDAGFSNPVLTSGTSQKTFVKVGVTGFELARASDRAPVNIALVLDTSGSMSGEKITRAKEAAQMAIERLSVNDIVSVVTYNSTAEVLVPATRLTDKASIVAAIESLQAEGSTALFAGVSKGAAELRKFKKDDRVNRIVLLSDGQANIGPNTANELGALGQSLIKEGISVTTLGLGLDYNEDLMAKLAIKSDGNHAFVEKAQELAKFFKLEFGDVLSAVAQEVAIKVEFADGVRPLRALGREVEIFEKSAFALINQLYSSHEKYLLLEVDVDSQVPGTKKLGQVTVTYMNLQTQKTDTLVSDLSVRFTESTEEVASNVDNEVSSLAVKQIATSTNDEALKLRDDGKVEEAQKLLEENYNYLMLNATKLNDKDLEKLGQSQADQSVQIEDATNWGYMRKTMRKWQQKQTQDSRY